MNKQDLIRKLTSRKFIISAISAISGVVVAIIGHAQEVTVISGMLMSVVPSVVYCIMEGKIDAASVKTIGSAASSAAEMFGATRTADQIEAITNVVEVLAEDDEPESK